MTKLVFEPSQTTHWKNLFPSKTMLLGAHNLNPGEELIAKITEVGEQTIKSQSGKDEQVPVIRFENCAPMVLNKTNSTTIASLYGPYTDQWIGRSVQIYAAMVSGFGKEQMALRVREAIPDTNEDLSDYQDALRACTSIEDLQKAFLAIPKHLKPKLVELKDEMKEALSEKS